MGCGKKIGKFDCCSVVPGDCVQLMNDMPDGCIDLVVTDPPYGVSYAGGMNRVERDAVVGDDDTLAYKHSLPGIARVLREGGSAYIWYASTKGLALYQAVDAAKLEVRAMIVWNKINAHYGAWMARYKQKHEPCLYVVKKSGIWEGPSTEVTVWDIVQPHRNEWHPTQKPIECMERAIRNSSRYGDLVFDPFCGSATTAIAAKRAGRHFLAFDINEKVCEDAMQRIALVDAQPLLDFGPRATQMPFFCLQQDDIDE